MFLKHLSIKHLKHFYIKHRVKMLMHSQMNLLILDFFFVTDHNEIISAIRNGQLHLLCIIGIFINSLGGTSGLF